MSIAAKLSATSFPSLLMAVPLSSKSEVKNNDVRCVIIRKGYLSYTVVEEQCVFPFLVFRQ